MSNEIHCAHILVKTEKEAQAAMQRLERGEKFANIAARSHFALRESAAEISAPLAEEGWLGNSKRLRLLFRKGKSHPS